MNKSENHENYPPSTVLLSNLLSFSIYALGFFILLKLGLIFSFIYLAYIAFIEFRVLRFHCVDCYYWGKTCGFGKGRISALFFKQGKAEKFCMKEITWKDMIPDLLISLVPFIAGVILLIINFSFNLLAALALLVFFNTSGNGFIRSKLTCKYCKQRDIGCPADQLFNKKR